MFTSTKQAPQHAHTLDEPAKQQKERGVNVVMWDNILDPPVGAAAIAWVAERKVLATAPYVAAKALTEASTGAAEIRSALSSVTRHPLRAHPSSSRADP